MALERLGEKEGHRRQETNLLVPADLVMLGTAADPRHAGQAGADTRI
jgi:hypothetical protein